MSHTSDSTPGSNNFPGGSRDSSIGSSGSRDSGRGRSNSQEGGSLEQPPQRFSIGLSGPQPVVASLPRSQSGGISSPQNETPPLEPAQLLGNPSFLRYQFIQSTQERFSHLNSTPEHQVEAREVRARMELPMVRAVLETGVSRNSVMQVIERRLRETGDDYPTAEALLNAVLTLEENPGALNVSSSHDLGAMDIPPNIPPEIPPYIPLDITPPPPDPSPTRTNQRTPNSGGTSSNTTVEPGSKDLEEENRLLREQKTCKICLDAEVGVVFLPCGHLCCCVMCAPAVRQCPICRAEIRGTVRTFIP
ncbi:death-associated inhibitor of apoptosis 2-like [Magallana gigas]|uniref:death-associated inhibitor of apoptosis 2-like n=1 Tax=Magallana gigas TaxID=29159 RepID=UPI00333E7137